jgi:hypothetical protein
MTRFICILSLGFTVLGLIVSTYAFIRFRMWLESPLDLTWVPFPIAFVFAWFALVVLFRQGTSHSSAFTGAAFGGSLVFVAAGLLLWRTVVHHTASVLTDGEVWWEDWFLPIAYLALPATLVGLVGGVLIGRFVKPTLNPKQ